MTIHSVNHSTIIAERVYDASPARVFAAWSTADALLRWAVPKADWEASIDHFDFRVGGGQTSRFGPKGGEVYLNETRYEDVVPNARIVSSGAMTCGIRRLFVGLLTVDLRDTPSGCRLILTEQGVFLDDHDQPANHEGGWNAMLDRLVAELR